MQTEPQRVYPIPGFAEPVSCFTHLFSTPVFLLLAVLLIRRFRQRWHHWTSVSVFAFATLFMLSMSGVYHLLAPGTAGREVLWRLDHASIFFLIAATFTPVHVVLFKGVLRWGVLSLIWALAITAITLRSIFFHSFAEWFSLLLYIGFGWVGLFSGILIARKMGFQFIKPLLYGGIAYSMGAVFEFLRWPVLIPKVVEAHDLFHFAVLIGLGFHWRFIWNLSHWHKP